MTLFSSIRIWFFLAALALTISPCLAQNEFFFTFSDPIFTDSKTIRLQAFEYRPQNPNGKVIVFSHGSVGLSTDERVIKAPIKFLNTAKFATEYGYTFVTFMRKGRGSSEGDFTEQLRDCSWGESNRQHKEAELQLEQVIRQVQERYGVKSVVLMGHSRGGLLSAHYAATHPDQVQAVVNLAGVWNAGCQSKDGYFSRIRLEEAARGFKPQFWAYFENDSYFSTDTFNDPGYEWLRKTTTLNDIMLRIFSAGDRRDGHEAPVWIPREWATFFLPLMREALK